MKYQYYRRSFNQLLFAIALIITPLVASAQFSIVETPGGSSSANRRGPCTSCGFQRYVGLYPSTEVSPIFPNGDSVAVVGWNVLTPLATPQVSGNIVILLSNTTDATYNKGLSWSGAIVGMDTVYVGPLTIDTTVGPMDVILQNKFGYTGDGVYLAFEWTTSNQGGAEASYVANTSVSPGMARYFNTTGHTDNLGATAVWRTQLRLGYDLPAVDLALSDNGTSSNDCGSTNGTFELRVTNQGLTTTDTVFYHYDLVGPSTNVSMNAFEVVAIQTDSSAVITVNETLNNNGEYTFDAYLTQPGDALPINDTAGTIKVAKFPTVSSFPASENFDGAGQDWSSNNAASSINDWALGAPSGTVINSAASAPNAWVTNLSGNYGDAQDAWVTSPCFDLTGVTMPQIDANIYWDIETDWDAAILEARSASSPAWATVGGLGTGTNWYNSNSANLVNGLPAAWNGDGASSSGGWLAASHDLNSYAGQADVQVRFRFISDGNTNNEGFAFDDVMISDASGSAPTAGFSFVPNGLEVAFTDASTGAPSTWAWDFGDGNTSAMQSPTHTYAANGSYTACLTATNANGSDSMCATVSVVSGLEDAFGKSLSIYPNPVADQLTIELENQNSSSVSFRLVDAFGRTHKYGELNTNGLIKEQLDVSDLPAGIYFIEINDGSKRAARRITIE